VILRASVAVAVAKKAGRRIETAWLECAAQDIARGLRPLARLEIADHVTNQE
jgi:hypothetical protein